MKGIGLDLVSAEDSDLDAGEVGLSPAAVAEAAATMLTLKALGMSDVEAVREAAKAVPLRGLLEYIGNMGETVPMSCHLLANAVCASLEDPAEHIDWLAEQDLNPLDLCVWLENPKFIGSFGFGGKPGSLTS